MKKINIFYAVTFLAGSLMTSIGWLSYEYKVDLKRNEERYFDLALQLKWHLLTIKSLRKNDINSAEKYQVEQINILLPILNKYGEDSTKSYEKQVKEIIDEARKYQAGISGV